MRSIKDTVVGVILFGDLELRHPHCVCNTRYR